MGDGPEKAKLEEHFAGTNAHFTGMITGDDLAAAYASLDVFVMPSESETLGFVVMEAMASGVPVVAVRREREQPPRRPLGGVERRQLALKGAEGRY